MNYQKDYNSLHKRDTSPVLQAMMKPKGYYYTVLVKRYANLTSQELSVRKELGLEIFKEYQHTRNRQIYLEDKDVNTDSYLKTEVYYVKLTSFYLGKLSMNIAVRGDKFDLVIAYSEHRIIPKTSGPFRSVNHPFVPFRFNGIYNNKIRSSWRRTRHIHRRGRKLLPDIRDKD